MTAARVEPLYVVRARRTVHGELPRPRRGAVVIEAADAALPLVRARLGIRCSVTWHARETAAMAVWVARAVLGLASATTDELPVAEHRPEWGRPERVTRAAHAALTMGRTPPPPLVPRLPRKLKLIATVTKPPPDGSGGAA